MTLRKQGTALLAGRRRRLGCITFVAVLLNAAVGFAQPAHRPAAFCPAEPAASPGTELISVTEMCTSDDLIGRVPSNAAETVASLDGRTVHLVYSDRSDPSDAIVVTLVDGQCARTSRVNRNPAETSDSHDAPSAFVDGEGYVYVAYHADTYNLDGPLIRKSREPGVPIGFGPEITSRTYSGAEVHGFTGRDGAVYVVSHNTSTRLEVFEPNGQGGAISYRYPQGPLQVIVGDGGELSIPGCTGAATKYNRFTKGYITEGVKSDGSTILMAVWGWGGDNGGPACRDIQHYGQDSHEVFFAYSEDGGKTWWNREGTTSRVAEHCTAGNGCPGTDHGIVMNDRAFMLTSTRQREFRAAYYDAATDTIYVAFSRSLWCDKGTCTTQQPRDPGALMLLRFQLDSGFVVQRKISNGAYQFIAAITKGDGLLSVYASDGGMLYEHVSHDDGTTWQRNFVDWVGRAHGIAPLACSPSTVLVAGAANWNPLSYFRRTFGGGGSGGGPRDPPPPAPLTAAQAQCVAEVDKSAGRLVIRQEGHHRRCLIQAVDETLRTPTFEDCVALEETKLASAESSVLATYASYCASDATPLFGLLDDMDALNQAVIQSGDASTQDLFGQPASIQTRASNPIGAVCQQAAMDARIALSDAFWEEARGATELALGEGAVTTDAELVASLDAALAASPRVASELATFESRIVDDCPNQAGGLFAGLCDASTRGAVAPCLGQRVLCRACQGFDATGNLGLDCEAISGGLCP